MKYEINEHVVITTAPDNKIHKVVSRHSNVYGLDNGKFYLGTEPAKSTLKTGDRFYFFKNMKDSDSIAVGYKGVVGGFWNGEIVSEDDAIFLTTEVKPLITRRAVFGVNIQEQKNDTK